MVAAFYPVIRKPCPVWDQSLFKNLLRSIECCVHPIRIDIVQPLYFVIDALTDLQTLGEMDLLQLIRTAMQQPMYEPLFTPKQA